MHAQQPYRRLICTRHLPGNSKAFGVAASIDNFNLAKVMKAMGVKVR